MFAVLEEALPAFNSILVRCRAQARYAEVDHTVPLKREPTGSTYPCQRIGRRITGKEERL